MDLLMLMACDLRIKARCDGLWTQIRLETTPNHPCPDEQSIRVHGPNRHHHASPIDNVFLRAPTSLPAWFWRSGLSLHAPQLHDSLIK